MPENQKIICIEITYGGGYEQCFSGAEVIYPSINSEEQIEEWAAHQAGFLRRDPHNNHNKLFIFIDEHLNEVRRIDFPNLAWIDNPEKRAALTKELQEHRKREKGRQKRR